MLPCRVEHEILNVYATWIRVYRDHDYMVGRSHGISWHDKPSCEEGDI